MRPRTVLLAVAFLIAPSIANAAVLTVGDGKQYPNINMALVAAKKGDEISVFPSKNPNAYDKTVLLVRVPNLYIHAADPKTPIKLNGAGFDFSGDGKVPRAIVQFDPTATGGTLEGFELTGAHNKSHNGAGVRINQANDITIRHCIIDGNDMGIMSNGSVKENTGANQLIESCLIQKNGDFKEPGQNHNLYLGGTSVTVRGCEIAFSLTGHNLKSRAHHNWIEYNFIHDSANRELDLVDGEGNTDAPGSDTVLLGNIIRKDPNNEGNHTVIQFGKDGKADHTGTLWLVHNTIISPFDRPIVDASAPGATCAFLNNLFVDRPKEKTPLLGPRNGAKDSPLKSEGNSFIVNITDHADATIVPWQKLDLPWEAFGKKPADLMQYAADQKIEPRAATTDPGAAGRYK